jgi:thiol-disulfide isomerase/thioredoxin
MSKLGMSLRVEYVKAEWCKVCKTLLPEVKVICEKFQIDLKVLSLEEMDDEQQSAIKSLPLLTVYEDDKVKEIITEKKKDRLHKILSEANVQMLADF